MKQNIWAKAAFMLVCGALLALLPIGLMLPFSVPHMLVYITVCLVLAKLGDFLFDAIWDESPE